MKIGSKRNRIMSKMVHLDLLRGIKETSILTDTSIDVLKNGHENQDLPFPSVQIEGAYLFYIPTHMLRTIRKVQYLGVTKTMQFLRYLDRNGLNRLMEQDHDWESYNLEEWQ